MAHQRRKSSRSANTRLPSDLYPELLTRLKQLEPSVKTDYLLKEISSKFVSSDTDPADVRRQRAIDKWLAAEVSNEVTNERLQTTHEEYQILPRVSLKRFIKACRALVVDIIGETVPIDALIGGFSGGASTSRNRTESHPAGKFLGKAHATREAINVFSYVYDEMPGWLMVGDVLDIEYVPGNVLFTVPKKTDIDRVACKEPDINMFLQKGIGAHFRRALRSRAGINLNDQSINRRLAREGSITGSLATLDLSSASDSVTTELVRMMLPVYWFHWLDAVRCQITTIDGDSHRNQMFSSMGNGFTFELESLLFYVLARTTARLTGTPGVISVYGDDIVCPSEMADLFVSVLRFFGFRTNTDKSFITGPFRESCGGHYHNGVDITPFYIREPILKLTDVIHAANSLRSWGCRGGESVVDPEIEAVWLWLKSYIPRYLWGGEDPSSIVQLVSRDTPVMRLQEEHKSQGTGLGGYFHWLNTTWTRTSSTDAVVTSRRTSDNFSGKGTFRLRKVRDAVPRLPALFLHELGLASE